MISLKEKLRKELEELIKNGNGLLKLVDDLDEFNSEYQDWLAVASKLIKYINPDRLDEFIKLYSDEDRKRIVYLTYTIKDYLLKVFIPHRSGGSVGEFNHKESFINKLKLQVNIIKSLLTSFDSSIFNLKGELEYNIFEMEIDSSEYLLKQGYIRAAGNIAGCVLESHLKSVLLKYNININKKDPTIADLAGLLRINDNNNEIINVNYEKKIVNLGRIRNKCTHKKNEDPTKEEVIELIDGVKKVMMDIS